MGGRGLHRAQHVHELVGRHRVPAVGVPAPAVHRREGGVRPGPIGGVEVVLAGPVVVAPELAQAAGRRDGRLQLPLGPHQVLAGRVRQALGVQLRGEPVEGGGARGADLHLQQRGLASDGAGVGDPPNTADATGAGRGVAVVDIRVVDGQADRRQPRRDRARRRSRRRRPGPVARRHRSRRTPAPGSSAAGDGVPAARSAPARAAGRTGGRAVDTTDGSAGRGSDNGGATGGGRRDGDRRGRGSRGGCRRHR